MTDSRCQFAEALAEWREQPWERAGVKQTERARRISYDRTTVCHAERGGVVPAVKFGRRVIKCSVHAER